MPEPALIEPIIIPVALKIYPVIEDYLDSRDYRVWQPTQYREVPEEDKNPISFVNPPLLLEWQMDRILRWGTLIDIVIREYNYPPEYRMIVLGIIAQETQGDPYAVCNAFDAERGNCAIGLMGVTPHSQNNVADKLGDPDVNIKIGVWIFDTVYKQALGHNFKPGREAIRAALAAYNCSWSSLLSNRCYSFGGWTYADKVLFYWIPLLETRLGELE